MRILFHFIIRVETIFKMFLKTYSNFVRPASPTEQVISKPSQGNSTLSGKEARRLYLEEVNKANDAFLISSIACSSAQTYTRPLKRKHEDKCFSDKDLFLAAQTDDVIFIKDTLHSCPDKINILDDHGWSLLMIACQANSIETVKELLERGVDTTIRDKAGNSAQSLVIQNKNFILADILVTHKQTNLEQTKSNVVSTTKVKLKEFYCSICNQTYPDEKEHLSSTIHNINASKGKKILAQYAIPQTNKGFQIMLKVGWDRNSGLGPEGTGKRYPIKTVQRKDRKGLGHGKTNKEAKEGTIKHKNRKALTREYEVNKKMEISYRREFY